MAPFHSQRSHVARLFESLRLQRGLRPGQLAARLGAANPSKVGGLIRTFELGEPICDHWLERLVAELQPDPAELRRCLELDQTETEERLAQERLEWVAWDDEPIDPYLSIRFMAGIGRCIPVPEDQRGNLEQAERWAAAQMQTFYGLRGVLHWRRHESRVLAPQASRPQRRSRNSTGEGR